MWRAPQRRLSPRIREDGRSEHRHCSNYVALIWAGTVSDASPSIFNKSLEQLQFQLLSRADGRGQCSARPVPPMRDCVTSLCHPSHPLQPPCRSSAPEARKRGPSPCLQEASGPGSWNGNWARATGRIRQSAAEMCRRLCALWPTSLLLTAHLQWDAWPALHSAEDWASRRARSVPIPAAPRGSCRHRLVQTWSSGCSAAFHAGPASLLHIFRGVLRRQPAPHPCPTLPCPRIPLHH